MAVRKVLQATDPRGEAVLRSKSRKVRVFDHQLARLIDDMIETMHHYNGVGLAAPQVGQLQQVVVIELPPEEDEEDQDEPAMRLVMCNPEITWLSEEQVSGQEGCLSLLNWYGDVPRFEQVEVRYQTRRGKRRKMRTEGYLARAIQHELDHLQGVLFTDRIEDLSTLVRLTSEGAEPVLLAEVPSRLG
ncbi:MAG: peptide deformylase [Chloroflexia bacterium]|nr:peptide deformylase [Chloroflexia bacterium]